jgi:hypothetical protein
MNPIDLYAQLIRLEGVSKYLRAIFASVPEDVASSLLKEAGLPVDAEQLRRLSDPLVRLVIAYKGLTEPLLGQLRPEQRAQLMNRLFVCEFPTGDFNAQVVRVPDGEGHLVLLNIGLNGLLVSLLKIALTQVVWGVPDERVTLTSRLKASTDEGQLNWDDARERWHETIEQYIRERAWYPTKGYKRIVLSHPAAQMLRLIMAKSVKQFVIAHELAHIASGHMSGAPSVMQTLIGGAAVETVRKQSADELQADLLALPLMLHAIPWNNRSEMQAIELEAIVAGIMFYFEVATQIEDMAPPADSSHPPMSVRQRLMFEALGKIYGGAGLDLANSVADVVRGLAS